MSVTRRSRAFVIVGLLAGLRAEPGACEQMRVAASTPAELQTGEAQGLAVTSRGRLFPAPRLSALGKTVPNGGPSLVFAAVADSTGRVLLGTGPDGQILQLSHTGETKVLFRVDEPLVTALLALANGEILAGSAPGGKIYKVRPDGTGSVWCETGERYVWALAARSDGSVLAATGDRGRLLKIDRNGHASVWFDSDETHLVSLAAAKDGGVWAGGSARGLVYKIDGEGHALVVYDDELPEARSIVVTGAGSLFVAFDAPPVSEKRPPALRLRVAGATTGTNEAMSDLDTRQAPALQGVIEGLPSAEVEDTLPLRGKLVRIAPDGTAVELWRSRGEAPFAVTLDDRERAVFATGEPAKLWRVEGSGEISLLATLPEAQATAFANTAGTIVAATSNPAASYRMEREASDAGTYLAPPTDAGGVARWGSLSWRGSGSGGRVELFTRTGNCEDPDGTWSAWSPAQVEPSGSPVKNPEGRFLQWRAKISGVTGDGPGITSVTATYATRNRQPSIRDLRIDPAAGYIASKATIRWSTADPDGDGVAVDVQVRPVGIEAWKSAVRTDAAAPKASDPSLGNDASSKDGKATWDTATWDEGVYELRGLASDQPGNPPSEALEAESETPLIVRVDRTPPSVAAKRSGGTIEVMVTDALSPVVRLEAVVDGRVAFSPRSDDGVSDGLRESYRIPTAQFAARGTWTLRATDAAGNASETPVPTP